MKVVVALSLLLNLFTKPRFTQPGFTCSQLIGESEHVGFQLPDEFTNQLPGWSAAGRLKSRPAHSMMAPVEVAHQRRLQPSYGPITTCKWLKKKLLSDI